ncbi:MAG: hypothetical protein D5R97_04465, partial [Candidatus Syntrophonatronum acetioxidans]
MKKFVRTNKWIPLFIILFLILLIIPSCQDMNPGGLKEILNPSGEEPVREEPRSGVSPGDEEETEDTEPEPDPVEIRISAVGDIMVHSTQYNAQYDPSTDSY